MNWSDVIHISQKGNPAPPKRVEKTNEEWQSILTEEEYDVCRQKGTERAFSSEMCSKFEAGVYQCKCCGTELFDASEKYDSGSGWPSFTEPLKTNVVAYHKDVSFGMIRVECTCNICDAHLGHVFPDGPKPTGLRFCINALSLKKI